MSRNPAAAGTPSAGASVEAIDPCWPGGARKVNRMLAINAPTTPPSRAMSRSSSNRSPRMSRAIRYAIPPPTNGVSVHSVRISAYFAHAGAPPIASPTPITAPVTVNEVAMG